MAKDGPDTSNSPTLAADNSNNPLYQQSYQQTYNAMIKSGFSPAMAAQYAASGAAQSVANEASLGEGPSAASYASYTPKQLGSVLGTAALGSVTVGANQDATGANNGDRPTKGDALVTPEQAQATSALDAYGPSLAPQKGLEQEILDPLIGAGVVAGLGAIAAPAFAAGAADVGLTGTAAGVASGAATGATVGAAKGVLTGGNVGEDALLGAVGGGAGAAGAGLGNEISSVSGLSAPIASDIGRTVAGAGAGAITADVTGGNVGEGAELGAAGGLIKGVTGQLASGITGETGSSTVGGIAGGLAGSELTGLADSAITSSASSSSGSAPKYEASSSSTGSTLSAGVAPLAVGAASMALGPNGAVTSGLGPNGAVTSDQLLSGAGPLNNDDLGANLTDGTAANIQGSTGSGSSSFLGDIGTGLLGTLGASSLGSAIGGAIPYAAVAGIGLEQAKAGEANDAKYSQQQQALAAPAINQSNSLLGQYNSGQLNSTDQAVVDTGIAQGQNTIASANGLSSIAQTAFSNYNSGKLNAGDQAALDQQVAAQKQQVAQQLASAGITDSTILAAQNQQIDNNALISKQNTLNGYFNTGNSAYNSWLTATDQGKAAITQAQTFASQSLNNYLSSSMAEAGLGIGEVNTAIQTQMTTDANYAAQVSTLLGTLATAYAKGLAGTASNSGTNGINAGNAAGNAVGNAAQTIAANGGHGIADGSKVTLGGSGGILDSDTLTQTGDANDDLVLQDLESQDLTGDALSNIFQSDQNFFMDDNNLPGSDYDSYDFGDDGS